MCNINQNLHNGSVLQKLTVESGGQEESLSSVDICYNVLTDKEWNAWQLIQHITF